MSSLFVADMRKQSYSEMNDPAPVVNTLVIQDSTIPGSGAANFDMTKVDRGNVTAGRFTFTPGAGWNNATGWDKAGSAFDYGTYDYYGGTGFDPFTADWTGFFNYDQNALACQRLNHFARVDEGNGGVGSCPGHP